ncbi:hypothetical protein CMO88_00985 [Candidatus Woesearchaeota archaeon]|nr:hypothetical protein [Candidatus Woesearchaeota archaeon]|tara:strand:- start:5746 stop:6774 length:1029 start_codon:yes stop_codon:yes gene_type:complete
MKVGIISKFMPEKDGIAIYSENLCRELSKICKVVKIGDLKSESADYKVNFKSFRLKSQLQRIIEKEQLDVLHIQYIAAYFGRHTLNLNLLQSLGQKIPVVNTMHEVHYNYEGYNFLRKKAMAFLEKEIVRKSRMIIAHTPQQKAFLAKKYDAKNVTCICHGLELFDVSHKKSNKILFFGKISRKKGLEMLIKAMKMLPEYHLKIIGSFVDKKQEKQIRKMVDVPNISFKFGWVSNKERWKQFREADLLVLPYLQAQYQSGPLHNAVSVGIPVVVTNAGALPEMVEHFKFGEIVEKNPKAVANGIKKTMKNYDQYKKGLAAYRKEANWKKTAENHLELYKKLC